MIIGTFHSAGDGFAGRIRTLLLDAELTIVPAQPSDAENAPAWRILLGDRTDAIEIGGGWNRSGERAGAFVALQIDDPALAVPLRANLLRTAQDDLYHLLWSRPAKRERR
jgi:uncharacterized protein (DUF736 family)